MNVKGPIKITIEGSRGSGKTQIANMIKFALDNLKLEWVEFSEGAEFKDYGQSISIIEKQT